MSEVRDAWKRVVGDGGDDVVKEYIFGVLEDESFEWGLNGEGALEAIGDFLVTPLMPLIML